MHMHMCLHMYMNAYIYDVSAMCVGGQRPHWLTGSPGPGVANHCKPLHVDARNHMGLLAERKVL